eukprot:g12544.t1
MNVEQAQVLPFFVCILVFQDLSRLEKWGSRLKAQLQKKGNLCGCTERLEYLFLYEFYLFTLRGIGAQCCVPQKCIHLKNLGSPGLARTRVTLNRGVTYQTQQDTVQTTKQTCLKMN